LSPYLDATSELRQLALLGEVEDLLGLQNVLQLVMQPTLRPSVFPTAWDRRGAKDQRVAIGRLQPVGEAATIFPPGLPDTVTAFLPTLETPLAPKKRPLPPRPEGHGG